MINSAVVCVFNYYYTLIYTQYSYYNLFTAIS